MIDVAYVVFLEGCLQPMWDKSVKADELLAAVGPVFAATADELARRVRGRWTAAELCPLLRDDRLEVRKVACVVLGLIGGRNQVGCVSVALHDEDGLVAELAEHALWSIWFRSGSEAALVEFQRGLGAMEKDDSDAAVRLFRAARRIDPGFAEAYNQAAMVHYLEDRWEDAAADCRRTIALMPEHFGALAGLGHCHAQLGELEKAAVCYRKALEIHPRLGEIRGMLDRIECG